MAMAKLIPDAPFYVLIDAYITRLNNNQFGCHKDTGKMCWAKKKEC